MAHGTCVGCLHSEGWSRRIASLRSAGDMVRLCFTSIKFHQCDCLDMSWMRTTKDMPQWMRGSPWRLNPTQRTRDNWVKLGVWGSSPHHEKHTNWLFSAKWSGLRTYTPVTVYALNSLYLGLHIYNTITINKKGGHEIEGDQRRVYRRVWREERKGIKML